MLVSFGGGGGGGVGPGATGFLKEVGEDFGQRGLGELAGRSPFLSVKRGSIRSLPTPLDQRPGKYPKHKAKYASICRCPGADTGFSEGGGGEGQGGPLRGGGVGGDRPCRRKNTI